MEVFSGMFSLKLSTSLIKKSELLPDGESGEVLYQTSPSEVVLGLHHKLIGGAQFVIFISHSSHRP